MEKFSVENSIVEINRLNTFNFAYLRCFHYSVLCGNYAGTGILFKKLRREIIQLRCFQF